MANKLVCPSSKPQHMGHHWREGEAVCLRPKCKAKSKSIFQVSLEEEKGVEKWGTIYPMVKLLLENWWGRGRKSGRPPKKGLGNGAYWYEDLPGQE